MDGDTLAGLWEQVLPEDLAAGAARREAGQVGPVPSRSTSSLLRWAAATTQATNVVEIGCGAGVSGMWLLDGMSPGGVLTSIDPDPDRHELAVAAYDRAGVSRRVRAILGQPRDVLGRLSDGGYQLCVVQHRPSRELLVECLRLLEASGMIVMIGFGDEPEAELLAELEDRERMTSALLPLDGGLVLATVHAPGGALTTDASDETAASGGDDAE